MSHLPPVRPDDASPIPDPVRSRPSGAVPKRPADPRDGGRSGGTGSVPPRRASNGRSGWGLAAATAAAGTLLAGVAGVAAARRLGRDTPPLYRSLKASPKEWRWSGFRIAWYENGPAEGTEAAGEPVVLVHSIHAAASAWEMRELFERLGQDENGARRVIALDLLGFGASDRPDVDYDSELYQDLLRDFVREVAGGSAHVLASSVSAAHALQAAAADPEPFRSLILVNPTGLLTQATGPTWTSRLLQNLVRLPFVGEALYNLLVSKPSLRYYDGQVYDDPSAAEASAEHHYTTAHQPGARYAPAAFLGEALGKNVYMALRTLEVPAMSIWSRTEITDTEREAEAFKAVAPNIRQTWIDGTGALPHDERADVVAGYVKGWLTTNE